jgi:hypothetical protein
MWNADDIIFVVRLGRQGQKVAGEGSLNIAETGHHTLTCLSIKHYITSLFNAALLSF